MYSEISTPARPYIQGQSVPYGDWVSCGSVFSSQKLRKISFGDNPMNRDKTVIRIKEWME